MVANTIFLLLLLVAGAIARKANECSYDEDSVILQIKNQVDRMEQEQMDELCYVESLISEILHTNGKTKTQIDKIEEMLENVQLQVQEHAKTTKAIKECQQFMHKMTINGSMFFSVSGVIFHFNATLVARKDAREYCEQKSMHLATLKTASQLESVAKFLKDRVKTGYFFWLWASDIGSKPGKFLWVDGTPVDKTIWYMGQPNSFNKEKETCTYLNTYNAKLYDQRCTLDWAYILCEDPSALASCL